jgi:four helix bundle protein
LKHNFKELVVWKRVRILVKEIYELSKSFPSEEKYGMQSQIRRAVLSISLNIIEGSARSTDKQFANFLDMSFGSARELQGILIHANDLGYISNQEFENYENECVEIQKMLFSFRNRIKKEL